jgi:transcription antitermination factor NusG
LFGDEEDRLSALKTNRLITVQRVPDGEQLRGQLLRLSELIALGAPLVRESRLIAGERVRVKSGPFRDNEGIVLRRNGKTELLIAIDFLQQGAALEIEDCLLEPV